MGCGDGRVGDDQDEGLDKGGKDGKLSSKRIEAEGEVVVVSEMVSVVRVERW